MTAFPDRRRRSTTIAASAAVLALVATAVLTVVGARVLWTSTSGSEVDAGAPELTFPETPTVLLVGLDHRGRPASLSVLVARPDRLGGSVVVAPVSIDASAGEGDERLPIAETAARSGPEAIGPEASIALGLSFHAVELADAERMRSLLAPFGDVEVTLPADVTGADGEVVARSGTRRLDAAGLAAVLTARDPSVPAATAAASTAAVWEGIAAAIGDGAGPEPARAGAASAESALAMLRAGTTATWLLRTRAVDPADNPDRLDVVILDRVEAALVFGEIAPGRTTASNPSASFRVVAAFTPEQMGDRNWSNADVAYQAISQVLFLRGNVLSVDTTPEGAPGVTRIEVMQPGLNVASMDELFGTIERADAERRIVGVDAELVLGEGYLEFLDEAVDRGLVTVGTATVDAAGDDD